MTTDWETEKLEMEMKKWAEKHPFAAVMMSNISQRRKLEYAENRFCEARQSQ